MVDSQNFLIVIYMPIQTLEILSVCTENKQKFMAPYPSGSTSGAFHTLILGSVGAIALEISDWTPGTFYILSSLSVPLDGFPLFIHLFWRMHIHLCK